MKNALHLRLVLLFAGLTVMMFALGACAPQGAFQPSAANSASDPNKAAAGTQTPPITVSIGNPPKTPQELETSGAPAGPATFQICSKLAFSSKLAWPSSLTATDREAVKLALNLAGSFEGETGWANLTNDFDGEGLSMGLLNQTLGTGSLEPLLIRMRDQYPTRLNALMTPAHVQSLLDMLGVWDGSGASQKAQAGPIADSSQGPLSPLDIDESSGAAMMEKAAGQGSTATAVRWAIDNLYNGSSSNAPFYSSWSKDLTALATSDEYVSIQIGAGLNLHTKALALEKSIGCSDLRCYLLMFDFMVQNGGLYSADLVDYKTYVKANPSADETTRLKYLVELRLRHVRQEFVADVRARKDAIVDGAGTVHGESRKFESQYCFNRLTPYPQ